MADDPVDLRRLSAGLARWAAESRPDLGVTIDDVKRLEAAANPLLVITRLAARLARRAGMTEKEMERLTASCKIKADAFADAEVSVGDPIATGRMTAYDAIRLVDTTLSDPDRRSRMPDWFVVELWPSVLRRAASGTIPTDREIAIAMQIVEDSRCD